MWEECNRQSWVSVYSSLLNLLFLFSDLNTCGWKRCHFYSKCVQSDVVKCECSPVTSDIISPVCGSDGKSYNNLAALELAACQEQKWIVPRHSGRCITGKSLNKFIEKYLF